MDLIGRLLAIDVSALSDADKTLPVVDPAVRAMIAGVRMAGPAFTVVAEDDHLPVMSALAEAARGDVLVVATNGGSPVFARGTTPRSGTSVSRAAPGAVVDLGGVEVSPGDVVFGDDDGLLIASAERIAAALDTAELIGRSERAILAAQARGEALHGLTNHAEHVAALDRGEDSALE